MMRTDGTTGSAHAEGRASTHRGDGVDMAVMRVNHFPHDRQPEARALRLGREKRTEDALEIVRRDARTVVSDLDHDLRRQRLAFARRLLLAGDDGRADVDVSFAAERLEGVGEQVREELPQLVRVGEQIRHVRDTCRSDRRCAPRACLLSAIVIESLKTSSSGTRSTCS